MICASCAEPIATAPCACGDDPLLDGRYRLDAVVGVGALATTYRATSLAQGHVVAIKELPLRGALRPDDRVLREARVLSELDHPRVPAFVEHFVAGRGRARALYIVQEFVDGPTLARELLERRYTQGDVLGVLEEVCDVLVYLHGLSPPVIHRDLKPGNVMRRPDGRLVLVDFGAVRDALVSDAATVAGTFGFMAPEQLTGGADPGTDLYGLGALAVALLTRVDPATLTDHAHRLRWRHATSVHPTVAALVDRLVEPDPRLRARDTEEVLAEIRTIRACMAQAPHVDPAPVPPAEAETVELPRPPLPLRTPRYVLVTVPEPSSLQRLLARVRRVRRRLTPRRA